MVNLISTRLLIMWIRKTFPLRRVRREILWKFLSSSQCLFTNPNFPFTMLMFSMLASRASLLNVERGKKRRGKLMILPLEIKTITLVFWNYFSFLSTCRGRMLWKMPLGWVQQLRNRLTCNPSSHADQKRGTSSSTAGRNHTRNHL